MPKIIRLVDRIWDMEPKTMLEIPTADRSENVVRTTVARLGRGDTVRVYTVKRVAGGVMVVRLV